MKNGYDQFFRDARRAASGPAGSAKPQAKPSAAKKPRFDLNAHQMEDELRRRASMKSKPKRKPYPWKTALVSAVGVLATGWAMLNAEQVEHVLKNVEVGWMGTASAAEAGKPAAAPDAAKGEAAAAKAPDAKAEPGAGEIDHLSKLTERSKELDAREQELARQETELAAQKDDLEKRLQELNEMRAKISDMLAERVKVDEQKVDTLVLMYSKMRAPAAAKIFETLEEDLAVDILGRMKKDKAADIMNFLKPEKVQTLSEKYAGYKRK